MSALLCCSQCFCCVEHADAEDYVDSDGVANDVLAALRAVEDHADVVDAVVFASRIGNAFVLAPWC